MLPLLHKADPPSQATWWWERLPNPHLLNLHTRRELTHAMSHKLRRLEDLPQPDSWLRSLLMLDGIHAVDVLRHHLRLRKDRGREWDEIFSALPQALQVDEARWRETPPLPSKDARLLSLPWPQEPDAPVQQPATPLVFEGVDAAAAHPLARALFSFPGLVMVRLGPASLLCKRAVPFSWDELTPSIHGCLPWLSSSLKPPERRS